MIWMTEKMQEIEQFLFYLRDIYSQNSKISINMRNIYSNLMFYGIDLSKKCKIKNFHEEWEEYFSNFDNIEVSGGNEGYFCHFQNILGGGTNWLKLYLSVDKEHIKQAVEDIFGFMAINNIEHISKVASEIRTDCIVIRLYTIEDLEKLKAYVKKCRSVSQGKLKTNPFLYKDDVFAYAMDGFISYNETFSSYLAEYFKLKKEQNDFGNVSFVDFYKFVANVFETVFVKEDNLEQYIDNFIIERDKWRLGIQGCLFDHYQVTYMFLAILNSNYSLDNVKNMHSQFRNPQLVDSLYDKFNKMLNPSTKKEERKEEEQKEKFYEYGIKKCVAVMSKKYGIEQARVNLLSYIKNNELSFITRDKGLRTMFKTEFTNTKAMEVLERLVGKGSFSEFAFNVLQEFDSKEVLKFATLETYNKYKSTDQLEHALNLGFDGKYIGFTNQNMARDKLIDNIPVAKFRDVIISSLGYDSNQEYPTEFLIEEYILYIFSEDFKKEFYSDNGVVYDR